jgi:ADP-ribose pyrophosphatase YjhB (NUDIX family)
MLLRLDDVPDRSTSVFAYFEQEIDGMRRVLLAHNTEKIVRDDRGNELFKKPEGHGLPGGKAEKGETIREALNVECFEEVGLVFELDDQVIVASGDETSSHVDCVVRAKRSFRPSWAQVKEILDLPRFDHREGERFRDYCRSIFQYYEEPKESDELRPNDMIDFGVKEAFWGDLDLVLQDTRGRRTSGDKIVAAFRGVPVYASHVRRIQYVNSF